MEAFECVDKTLRPPTVWMRYHQDTQQVLAGGGGGFTLLLPLVDKRAVLDIPTRGKQDRNR